MIDALESFTKEHFQALPRKGLEDLAWQEKQLISMLKDELQTALEAKEDLQLQTEQMSELLARLQKMLFGQSSEKAPAQGQRRGPAPASPDAPAHRSRLPSERYPHIPVVEHDLVPTTPPLCPCGHEMRDTGLREAIEQLTVIPRRFQIDRFFKPKFHCCHCHGPLVTLCPPRIRPGSSFSDEMILDVAIAKYHDLIPIERYAELAARDGVEGLPPHTLIDLTHYLAEFLTAVVNLIRQSLLQAPVLHADETPHRMLEGDETAKWFLWGFCDGKNSYFELHPTRSGTVASALLQEAQCHTLVSDVYAGYEKALTVVNTTRPPETQIQSAYCNAHSRRRFVEAQSAFPEEVQFYLDTYSEIYTLEAMCRQWGESELRAGDEKSARDCRKKREALRKEMRPRFEAMQSQGQDDLKKVSQQSALSRAITYFQNNFAGLTRCVSDPTIPLDNNLQERELRRPVIGRKTWYGTHSKKGAETAAKLFTIMQSCRLNHVNPREYLRAVVASLHSHGPPLTPWEYHQLHTPKS